MPGNSEMMVRTRASDRPVRTVWARVVWRPSALAAGLARPAAMPPPARRPRTSRPPTVCLRRHPLRPRRCTRVRTIVVARAKYCSSPIWGRAVIVTWCSPPMTSCRKRFETSPRGRT
eukprot:scaffold31528_cov28-Tisochrysis_lutea.AAC.4